MAGPLDELVKRILRRIDVFKTDHGLEEVEVTVELLDGSLHRLRTLSADPGYGFVSFRPHGGEDEPEELIVPLGAIREIRIGVPDGEHRLGYSPPSA